MSALAQAAAATGEFDRAEELARAITAPYWQAAALSATAQAVGRDRRFDRAEELARAITDRHKCAEALIMLAQLLIGESVDWQRPLPFSRHAAVWLKR